MFKQGDKVIPADYDTSAVHRLKFLIVGWQNMHKSVM